MYATTINNWRKMGKVETINQKENVHVIRAVHTDMNVQEAQRSYLDISYRRPSWRGWKLRES